MISIMQKRQIDDDSLDKLVTKYKEGSSLNDLSKEEGVSPNTIRRILVKLGVELRRFNNKRVVTSNPFIELSSPEVSYWLGFIAADGSLSSKTNNLRLALSEKDKDHLEKYLKFLGSGPSLRETYCKAFNKRGYSVDFGNKEVKQFLISIGITPNKSKTLEMRIPLDRHFVRGVIDGDGSIQKPKGYNGRTVTIVSGSKIFLEQISGFMMENTITHSIKSRNRSGRVHYLMIISGYANVKNLYDLLYKDSSIYLNRKKQAYLFEEPPTQ